MGERAWMREKGRCPRGEGGQAPTGERAPMREKGSSNNSPPTPAGYTFEYVSFTVMELIANYMSGQHQLHAYTIFVSGNIGWN